MMGLFSSNDEHFCTPFALHNNSNIRRGLIEKTRLDPENEYGNVEYKLKLTDPSPERVERLVTQLKWRIREGQGEAIIFLGVKDNGIFVGLSPEEIRLSLQTLETMSAKIGATMTVVNERLIENDENDEANTDNQASLRGKIIRNRASYGKHLKENTFSTRIANNIELGSESKSKKAGSSSKRNKQPLKKVIQILVKRKTHDISEELRIAVLGPTESGKSSLLGVLSHGEHDNGRGSARLNLFRHRHEIRSGHTSSISQEIFGFDCHGQAMTYSTCLTTEEIIESSSKIVTLIDLAGHQRYLSTTLFGLGSYSPDIVLLVVSANSPLTSTITEYISLALGMEMSLAIIINKIDLVSKESQENFYQELIMKLQTLHPEILPFRITDMNDATVAGSQIRESNTLPIFFTSCVSGSGLNALYRFFDGTCPMLNSVDLNLAINQPTELQVDETFEVPGIGTVVSGLMIEGTIREGDEMLLGPDDIGSFSNVSVISLQRHKIPCNFARAGQKCTMAIRTNNVKVRRGMVMKDMDHNWTRNFSTCLDFEAKIKFTTNKKYRLGCGSQISIYAGNVKQTCSILSIMPTINSFSIVNLRFTKRPEYIREGSRIMIRHAHTNGIGIVTRVIKLSNV